MTSKKDIQFCRFQMYQIPSKFRRLKLTIEAFGVEWRFVWNVNFFVNFHFLFSFDYFWIRINPRLHFITFHTNTHTHTHTNSSGLFIQPKRNTYYITLVFLRTGKHIPLVCLETLLIYHLIQLSVANPWIWFYSAEPLWKNDSTLTLLSLARLLFNL